MFTAYTLITEKSYSAEYKPEWIITSGRSKQDFGQKRAMLTRFSFCTTCWSKSTTLHIHFVDFKKTLNSVQRNSLGDHEKVWRTRQDMQQIVKALYESFQSVRLHDVRENRLIVLVQLKGNARLSSTLPWIDHLLPTLPAPDSHFSSSPW